MFVAFIPFSTALLGEYTDQQISVVIYGINIAIAGFWASLQWWYAAKNHRLIDPDLDPTFITIMSRRGIIGIILYLIAAALSFISTTVSLVLFIIIPVYYLIPVRIDKPGFGLPEINESSTEFPGSETGRAVIFDCLTFMSSVQYQNRRPLQDEV